MENGWQDTLRVHSLLFLVPQGPFCPIWYTGIRNQEESTKIATASSEVRTRLPRPPSQITIHQHGSQRLKAQAEYIRRNHVSRRDSWMHLPKVPFY